MENIEYSILGLFMSGNEYDKSGVWKEIGHKYPDFYHNHLDSDNCLINFREKKKFLNKVKKPIIYEEWFVISDLGRQAYSLERTKRRDAMEIGDLKDEKLKHEAKIAKWTYWTYWAMFGISLISLVISIIALTKKG